MRTPRSVLILLLLGVLTFLAGLGRPAITDADEAYYAEAAREMVERGDWLTPHFNYRYRFEKPVLYYWLTAATYLLAGPTEWAARLWSALSGIGLTMLTWSIARSLGPLPPGGGGLPPPLTGGGRLQEALFSGGAAGTAWLAGAIVATSFGYVAEARMALPDLPLAFFITLGIWAALRATLDNEDGLPRTGWWAIAGISAGLGFLMKGPVALVVPAVVLLPIWWRERPAGGFVRGCAVAAAAFAAIGLPWYVAMWAEHGAPYLSSFFISDNVERFATGRFNARRIPGYYVAVLLGGLLPWSAYLVALPMATLPRLRSGVRRLTNAEWRLLIWAGMPLIFFTVSVGQQPRYILPVLPPLAVLLASAFTRRVDEASAGAGAGALRRATWCTAVLFAALALVLVRAQPILITAYPLLTWTAAAVTAAAALALAWVAWAGRWTRLAPVMVAAAAIVLLAVQFGGLAGRRPEPVEEMAALVIANRLSSEPVAEYRAFVRNLVFYTRFPHVEIFDDQPAIDFMKSPQRVLLVIPAGELDRLRQVSGVAMRTIAGVRYVNTANLKIGTLLRPDPAAHVETVLLVTNR